MQFWKTAALTAIAVLGIAANDIPDAREGGRDSVVHDGKQNYPVRLYGIARDWSSDCVRGRARDCERLGDAFLSGLGDLEQDLRAAMGYWLLACNAGSGDACVKAANAIEAGTTHYPANPRLAFETASKGCDADHDASCAIASLHYYRGDVVAQDRPLALAGWNHGCASGDEDSCRLKAGALFFESTNAADHREAVQLYRAGCERNQGWGCSGYADALRSGKGVAQDEDRAFTIARQGCREGEGGNSVLACVIYAKRLGNSGNTDDVQMAGSLLTNACLSGQAEGCYEAGNLGYANRPGSRIADWEVPLSFREGCDMGHAASCSTLGALYDEGYGSLKVNQVRSIALMDRACKMGDAFGCTIMQTYGSRADSALTQVPAINPADPADVQIAQAMAMLDDPLQGETALIAVARLMEEGVADAEWLMGGWFYYGLPGLLDQNRNNGIILIENAARQRHLEALKWISMAYWEGSGVPMDRQKGSAYMAYAAAQGDEESIAIYRSMLMQPERDRRARQAEEARQLAEARQNDFWYQFGLAMSSMASSASSYSPSTTQRMADQSWQRHQSAMDQLHWNQRMDYLTGASSACNRSNPYC